MTEIILVEIKIQGKRRILRTVLEESEENLKNILVTKNITLNYWRMSIKKKKNTKIILVCTYNETTRSCVKPDGDTFERVDK